MFVLPPTQTVPSGSGVIVTSLARPSRPCGGANLSCYGPAITSLTLTETKPLMLRR
jgi:hypothetical protein